MNEQPTEEMFRIVNDVRIPDSIQAFTAESVSRTREGYTKLSAAAKESTQVVGEVMLAAQSDAWAISGKMLSNALANIGNSLDAAQAMTRAKTIPDVMALQGKFMREQLAVGGAQARELFELSAKAARQTFEGCSGVATKTLASLSDAG